MNSADSDGDGVDDGSDACPLDPNNDADNDGVCVGAGFMAPKVAGLDNCPTTYNPPSDCDDNDVTPDEQCDLNGDGEGDACDTDIDGDTIDNGVDSSMTRPCCMAAMACRASDSDRY